ncbi:hypothetical protein JNM87_06100 [Candidatus Saccharibacteria bacterium]|nr:hypothetical protein [Candidatus Saccharibacteria bacterium]
MTARQKLVAIGSGAFALMLIVIISFGFLPFRGYLASLPILLIGICGLTTWLAFFAAFSTDQLQEAESHESPLELLKWLFSRLK